MASAAGQKAITLPAVEMVMSGVVYPCFSEPMASHSILIQADQDNIGPIYVGDETVTETTGISLNPGGAHFIHADAGSLKWSEFDVSDLHVISGTAGNKARIQCIRRRRS